MKPEPKLLAGQLSISLPSNSRDDDPAMEIRVEDDLSRVQFLKIYIPAGDLMKALTARHVKCKFELRAVSRVGTRSEHKTCLVLFDRFGMGEAFNKERRGLDRHERSATVTAVLAPFEVDGWRASISDLFNGHRLELDGEIPYQRVSFNRHVNAETGEPIL